MAKRYGALVAGVPATEHGEICLALAESHLRTEPAPEGKEAVTRYRVLEAFSAAHAALVELEPLTGRMHQLRVHLAAIGHPVLGDPKYGGAHAGSAPRLMLHASHIELPHPRDGQPLVLASQLPEDFTAVVARLR